MNEQALVLVVDAEQGALDTASSVLVRAGYACRACSNVEAAIDFAQQAIPDLFIFDVNLGGRSGLELCERIKQDRRLRHVPAMFLSAAQSPDIIRRSDAAGGTYYLRKPFDPEVLVALVEKTCGFRT